MQRASRHVCDETFFGAKSAMCKTDVIQNSHQAKPPPSQSDCDYRGHNNKTAIRPVSTCFHDLIAMGQRVGIPTDPDFSISSQRQRQLCVQ